MKRWLSVWFVTSFSVFVLAQDSFDSIEAELNSAQGKPAAPAPQQSPSSEIPTSTTPTPTPTQARPPVSPRPRARAQQFPLEPEYRPQADPENEISRPVNRKRGSLVDEENRIQEQILRNKGLLEPGMGSNRRRGSLVDEEMRIQDRILKNKESQDPEVSTDREVDRFPKQQPAFSKPPGPKQGGSVRVEHPKAAEGLIRINRDGSYQYKTPLREKSQSGSLRAGMMTPPTITTDQPNINYESMYGTDNIMAVEGDYTWQPFRSFGALGLKVGAGFATVSGSGFFENYEEGDDRGERSEESYDLYIVPLSLFVEYRFEYFRRQWVVPFLVGGGTYYGLMELRDDGADPVFSGAPAVGGGGGFLFSISRLDTAGAFTLSQEYGIADMWLVVEGRIMQGLSEDVDFSNETISAGIQVDF